MTSLLSKLLAITLAVLMTGSTGICACGSTHSCGMVMTKKEAKPACQKGCGKSDSQKNPAKSSQSHQCPGCKVTNNLDRPAASRDHAAAMSVLSAALVPVPVPMVVRPIELPRNPQS